MLVLFVSVVSAETNTYTGTLDSANPNDSYTIAGVQAGDAISVTCSTSGGHSDAYVYGPSGSVVTGSCCPGTWNFTAAASGDYRVDVVMFWEPSPYTLTIVRPDVDVCPNLEGAQAEVPAGLITDEAGNCVEPPVIEPPVVEPPAEEEPEEVVPGPGPDMVPLPEGAVVGKFVEDSLLYFAPDFEASTDLTMPAGKTLWVLGVDASGQFYHVVLSGKYLWAPVSAMAPNDDNVWLSEPLPTDVVE